MSSEIIQLNLNKPEDRPNPEKEWFDSYLEGNMRVPQTGFGIELFVLNTVLKSGDGKLNKLIKSKISPEQLKRMREAMNAAHAAKHIPNRSSEEIHKAVGEIKQASGKIYQPNPFEVTDDRLSLLWDGFKFRTLRLIGRIILGAGKKIEQNDETSDRNEVILFLNTNPEILETIKKLASLGIEALRSEEGKKLASEYRDNFNLKKHGQPPTPGDSSFELFEHLSQKAENSRKALVNYIAKYITGNNTDLASFISPDKLAEALLSEN